MVEQISQGFEENFLLQFTKELIRNAGASEVFKLENMLNEEPNLQGHLYSKEQIKDKVHEVIKEKKEVQEEPVFEMFAKPFPIKKTRLFDSPSKRRLSIPEPRLPLRLQYLKPTPKNFQIDLWKLNPLVKDPLVKSIECNGPDENIVVNGTMGIKPTKITLSAEEISQIVQQFSEIAKIPTHEGVFRVVAGKLILLATISEVIGTKFIIKKMMYRAKF